MRVAVNALAFGDQAGGVGRYVRELVPAMLGADPELELVVFAAQDAPPWIPALVASPHVRVIRLRGRSDRPQELYPAQLAGLSALAARLGCDVIHGPANFAPLVGRVPTVATIHDVMWIEHAALSGFSPMAARIWRTLTALSARAADVVVASSEATAADVVRLLGIPSTKIDTVLLGAGIGAATRATAEAELRERLGLTGRQVLLSVGQKRPHKNLETVIRALPRLPESVVLVAPGADEGHGAELERLAAELGVTDRVRLLAWVDDADLEGLYALAAVGAQMSFLEGFGLPALEAMQRDVPVVVSRAAAMVEATGGAAVVVDTEDDAALAAAIRGILEDPARATDLARRGRARVEELTWDRTARGTLASFRRAVGQRPASTRS